MYKLYERVSKTMDYPYGSKPVEDGMNPFLEGPCLLCVAAFDAKISSVLGMPKEGMKIARLRDKDIKNAGFDLDDFPVKFLGVDRLRRMEEEFTKEYLFPLITDENGQKRNTREAMKKMRNVNVFCYCDGLKTIKNIELALVTQMEKLGYTEEERRLIQSQMFICPLGVEPSVTIRDIESTCISFKDINDSRPEIEPSQLSVGGSMTYYSDNCFEYVVEDDGKHDIASYYQKGCLSVCLSSVVSNALENAITNARNPESFVPLTAEKVTAKLPSIMRLYEKGIDSSQLMQILDDHLQYGGAKRLTDYEVKILARCEEVCAKLVDVASQLKDSENRLNTSNARVRQLESVMRQNHSQGESQVTKGK